MKRIPLKDLTLSLEELKKLLNYLHKKRGINNNYTQFNELINYLITLRSILKDTVKIGKILELEIEKLEQKEINELMALKEKIFVMSILVTQVMILMAKKK